MNTAMQLERIRYWQGQLLASDDLRTQMRVVAELRRQHNRALHRAYGIAIGLTVGDVADGAITVSCGLAYDCSGRELMVPVSRTVPLPTPAIATPHLLVLAYDARSGDSTLAWQPQGTPAATDGVAIARILPGPPDPHRDAAFRPVIARPMARPRIAGGQTVRGNTAWEFWHEGQVSVGVQTQVDTSAYGFTTTPNYFAEAVTDNPTRDFIPAWFASISNPAPDSFTLRLFMRRITREAFELVDPKVQAAKTPPVGGVVTLKSGDAFKRLDVVSRLLPVAPQASVVKALAGNTATLDTPLEDFTGTKQVAFGNPPRIAAVTKAPAHAATLQIVVDTPQNFHSGDVVVKLDTTGNHPTRVVSIDDQDELELADQISLTNGDKLGIAGPPSLVTDATATTITVQNPELFARNDIVVCVDADIVSAQITNIGGASNEILTLTPAVTGLKTKHIAKVQLGGTVQTVDTEAGEVKIQVDQPKLFRTGDLVAKIVAPGAFSDPVRVQSVHSGSKTLTLSGPIAGLGLDDQIAAADFRVRATVLTATGTTVTLANAEIFPANSLVARLDDSYAPTGRAHVSTATAGTLMLREEISGLKPADILALCSFPISVTVESIDPDGILQVSPPWLLKAGDVVAPIPAHSGIAIVAVASGSSVQLATPISGLTTNDKLSVITVGGTVSITPGTSNTKVVLEADHRVRTGDFLADIKGWREPGPARSIAVVQDATGTNLTLSSPTGGAGQIDGLMINDSVGLASFSSGSPILLLRVKSIPAGITPGDEALLVGLDRLQGRTTSMFASVAAIVFTANLVVLVLEGTPGPFAIRPEDLTASILLVRGSPLALVQKQNLYVRWVACQDPDPMPRPCSDDDSPPNCCGKANLP